MTTTVINNMFIIISNINLQYQHYHKESTVSTLTPSCLRWPSWWASSSRTMLASFFQTRSTHLPFPGDLSCLMKMQRKWTFANWDMMIMMPGILANFVNDDSSDCKSWCQIFIIHYWIFILRKQHTNSNTKSHSVDYNLLPQVIFSSERLESVLYSTTLAKNISRSQSYVLSVLNFPIQQTPNSGAKTPMWKIPMAMKTLILCKTSTTDWTRSEQLMIS